MIDVTYTRPRTLRGITTMFQTGHGKLYLTVSVDSAGEPIELLGRLGKAGTLENGTTESICRLVSLLLRKGTTAEEIIGECEGIREMHPWPNRLPNGSSGAIVGIADAIAHILRPFVSHT